MNKEDFKHNVYLLLIGAAFSLIGAIIGGLIVIESTEDKSPFLAVSLVDANYSNNEIFIEVLNTEDYPAIGIWGIYGKKSEIPFLNKEISFFATSAIKGKPVTGAIDLSYLKNNISLNEELLVGASSTHVTYEIPFEIYCQNCEDKDVLYLNEYALVSFDMVCDDESSECGYEMSLISFA